MPLHKKMIPAKAETIFIKIFFAFSSVYLTGGASPEQRGLAGYPPQLALPSE